MSDLTSSQVGSQVDRCQLVCFFIPKSKNARPRSMIEDTTVIEDIDVRIGQSSKSIHRWNILSLMNQNSTNAITCHSQLSLIDLSSLADFIGLVERSGTLFVYLEKLMSPLDQHW